MSANPFGLLSEDDSDDLNQLVIAAQQLKAADPVQGKKAPAPAAAAAQRKLPSKPVPPAQAVREARNEGGRGGGRGRGRGRGGGGFNRELVNGENTFSGNADGFRSFQERDGGKGTERRGAYGAPRGSYRGGRRGGFNDGEAAEGERHPHRRFDRHSGTGHGNELKREGSGRGNWGTHTDEIAPEVEEAIAEKENVADSENAEVEQDGKATKEKLVEEPEEKKPEEDKEMTLEEYEKVLEEKRKALLALKPEERNVDIDAEFKSMQPLSCKKSNDEIFAKLGSDKEKRKDTTEKEEKTKKVVNLDFWMPAERERSAGRGRGRGRGGRGSGERGGFGGHGANRVASLANIQDPQHFPTLGVK